MKFLPKLHVKPIMSKQLNLVAQLRLGTVLILSGAFWVSLLNAQNGTSIQLKDGLNGYEGNEDFYTYRVEGGVFNSKTDLDDQTLLIAPLNLDAKTVMRFADIPVSRSVGTIYRLAVKLTFQRTGRADTIMLHNLGPQDIWDEYLGNYNSLNGSAVWSGADGKLIDAWSNTDGVAIVTGGEETLSTLTIEIHPSDEPARRAVLQSWLDGSNQGFVLRGINGENAFFSSDAYNPAHRPELIIEYSSY